MSNTVESLADRVARLERETFRWALVAGLAYLALGVLIVVCDGQRVTRVVRMVTTTVRAPGGGPPVRPIRP
jgi:hypothetical protein